MEDLYGNLENYNEVNALEELKSENMHLKMKLEDYAGSMEKLQKNILQDFDLLSSEFKKLEHNYSSLLKTARSEIERKTQIITNINMEKDMLVLTALKNGDKSVLHMKKNMPSFNKANNKIKGNGSVNKKNFQEAKEDKMQYERKNESDFGSKRSDEHPIPSSYKVNNDTMENTKKNIIAEPNPEYCNYVSSHIKGNVTYENIPNAVQFRPMDIKNRRKSIPATSVEGEKLGLGEKVDNIDRDSQLDDFIKDKEDRRSFLKFDNDRYSSKSSGTSSRDERILYHKPSRVMYRDRNYKHDNYKHRIRDKYDTSQKHKRYSPERYNKKSSRDYYEENCHRPDFNRVRTRESPDRFHHNSYKDYQAYEKKYYNEPDRYMRSPERYVAKHKIPYEYEEPYAKRPKPYSGREKEDVMWNGKEIVEHQELTETFERLEEQYTSCQSPDYIYNEIPTEPKVIMDTAETPLDDPRLATSKYILSNDNGLERISTTVGRNVNLKPVDKIRWNLQTVSMPCALTEPPMNEKLIKDIYTDIEEAHPMPQINLDEVGIDSQPIQNEHGTKDNPTKVYHEDVIDKPSCTKNDKLSIEKPTQGYLANYTISKVLKSHPEFKPDTVIKERSLEIIDSLYAIGNNINNNDKQYSQSDSSKLPLENVEKHGEIISNDFKNGHKTCVKNSIDEHDSQRVLSTREIVEGDLELSDETSDNTDMQKVLKDNITEKLKPCHSNLQDNLTISVIHKKQKDQNNTDKLSKNEPSNKDKKFQETKLAQCDNMEDHNENSKKQKRKQKAHKYKDSEHIIETVEKKSKVKKDRKEKPKEVTSKFNELFGDSNSLITPADLGIPASQAPSSTQNTAIYVPIFEDALDATDLEQNIEVKISKSKGIEEVITSAENDDKRHVDSKIDDISKGHSEVNHYDTKVSNQSVTNTILANTKLQNVNKENDVVATIIISTGIQPDEINTESRAESLMNAEELLSDDIERDQDDATHKTQNVLIKALATSTPYKQVHQIDSKIPELTCTSNSTLTLTNADCADTVVSNKNNTIDPTNEDLPDVRIFVKRRRRIVKTAK